jgi:hypothetical protein
MTLTLLPGGTSRDPSNEPFRAQAERFRRNQRAYTRKATEPVEPSGYEMVTRQMVESISEDVRDIRSKLNNLIFVLVGAILIDVFTRLLGA